MRVTCDREKGTINISQKGYTEDVVQPYGMEGCNPAYNPGVGLELSLNQPEEKFPNEVEKRCYKVTRYGILYAVNQLARVVSKPAKTNMRSAKHLLRYWAGFTDFSITYKGGGFRLSAFSDANWGNSPDNGSSTSSHTVTLANAAIILKVGLQRLTAQSTMEVKPVAVALARK